MVKDGDLPSRRRSAQGLLQPTGLSCIEIRGIDHEEFRKSVALLNRVIALAAHVEERVLALVLPSVLDIMIAEHGVKVDALRNQWRKRTLEVLIEMASAAVRVNIVTGSNHQIERRPPMRVAHLP